ncbi:Sterol regulatory element-binding protein 2 [Savitreella phatthalungensis]
MMGKQQQNSTGTSAYLATPPGSTQIRAPASYEVLPELALPPSSVVYKGSDQQPAARASSHGYAVPQAASSATNSSGSSNARRPKPSRKTTHSQIEKRRREKINDTMIRLKALVPACHGNEATLRKLDVLQATADYIEVLQARLRDVGESLSGSSDDDGEPRDRKRQRRSTACDSENEDEHASYDEDEDYNTPELQHRSGMQSPASSRASTATASGHIGSGAHAFTAPSTAKHSPEISRGSISPVDMLPPSLPGLSSRQLSSVGPGVPSAAPGAEDEALAAAESLVQISESPMLGPSHTPITNPITAISLTSPLALAPLAHPSPSKHPHPQPVHEHRKRVSIANLMHM